ncbi:MAG: hypothetical protein U5K37_00065 [Natrialbaceae archaeon]|nr:hypothetical protein [Natrialbaceae archaeon]
MATDVTTREYHELTIDFWGNIVVASIIGGVLMGLIMTEIMGMIQVVGALYGFETSRLGWVFHLWHSAVFGLFFGGFFMWHRIGKFHDRILASTTIGITWGMLLWVVAAGIVMPIWMGSLSAPAQPLPALNPWSGIGHLVYGAVLGGGAAALHKWF